MKAHIFDMDGTLLDSMGIWQHIDQDFLAGRGIAIPPNYEDYVEQTIPLSPRESAAYAIKFFNLKESVDEVIEEWYSIAETAYKGSIVLKPGAYDYLKKLRAKGAKMAIATSSPRILCIPALKNHGILDFFDAVCLSEEVGVGKIKPDVFLQAAERIGADPKDCIVYEDSLTAIKTAKSVGMTVYAVYDLTSDKNWKEIEQVADGLIYDFGTLAV